MTTSPAQPTTAATTTAATTAATTDAATTAPATGREPLRLELRPQPHAEHLAGAWWPQSRDLTVEVADLVDHFPEAAGRISRVLYSPPDWDGAHRRVTTARGVVKAGSFPRDDTGLMVLSMSDHRRLRLLVVPPATDEATARKTMADAG